MWFVLSLLVLVTIIASFVGFFTGFGTSTIMLPIAALVIPFGQAMILTTIVHWFRSFWMVFFLGKSANKKIAFYFGLFSIIASFFGSLLFTKTVSELYFRLFGVFLVFYMVLLHIFPKLSVKSRWYNVVLGGLLSGFSAGFFGIRGVIVSAFLRGFNLSKNSYLATIGFINIVTDVTRFAVYLIQGLWLDTYLLFGLSIFVPATFLGAYLARMAVERVSNELFKKIVTFFLGLVGMKFIVFGK